MITTDLYGNNVELIFIKYAKRNERKNRPGEYMKGYKLTFMLYGPEGRGYYYSRVIPTEQQAKELPKADCVINQFFTDCKDPKYHQLEYCRLNCDYKCLKREEYKI